MNNKYFFEIPIGTITLLEMLYTGIFAKMQIEIMQCREPQQKPRIILDEMFVQVGT